MQPSLILISALILILSPIGAKAEKTRRPPIKKQQQQQPTAYTVIGGDLPRASAPEQAPQHVTPVSAPTLVAKKMTSRCENLVSAYSQKDSEPSEQAPHQYEDHVAVLDTNVLILNPDSIYDFPGADIYIPLKVLEELDKFKREPDDRGRSARTFSRTVAQLRRDGKLSEGVALKNGSRLFMFAPNVNSDNRDNAKSLELDLKVADNQILAAALELQQKFPDKKVVLITEDINMWIKGDMLNLNSDGYRSSNKALANHQVFSGVTEVEIDREEMKKLKAQGFLAAPNASLHPNEFVILNVEGQNKNVVESVATRYDKETQQLRPVENLEKLNLPLEARNTEQSLALDLLLDDNIKLVSILGSAGTGKTLLSELAALYKTVWTSQPVYDEVLITRAMVSMGKDPGALPGDMAEKMDPYLRPFYDNLEVILEEIKLHNWSKEVEKGQAPVRQGPSPEQKVLQSLNSQERNRLRKLAQKRRLDDRDPRVLARLASELGFEPRENEQASLNGGHRSWAPRNIKEMTENKVNIVPLNFIRGRTFNRRLIIIDEAQNLSAHEVKTIITRAGKGTKIVFLGDIDQIDAPYLNAYNNGFSLLIELFRSEEIAGHVTLRQTERSELVDAAVRAFNAHENR